MSMKWIVLSSFALMVLGAPMLSAEEGKSETEKGKTETEESKSETEKGKTETEESKSETEKGKSEAVTLSTITLVAEEGGCSDDGPFCCRGDESKFQKAVQTVPGVKNVILERETKTITLKYEPGKLDLKALVTAAEKAGYGGLRL